MISTSIRITLTLFTVAMLVSITSCYLPSLKQEPVRNEGSEYDEKLTNQDSLPKPPCTISIPVTIPAEDTSSTFSEAVITYGWATINNLNLREEPSLDSKVLHKLNQGDKVVIKDSVGDWFSVRYDTDSVAYVHSKYISLKELLTPVEYFKKQVFGYGGIVLAVDKGYTESDVFVGVDDTWFYLMSYEKERIASNLFSIWNSVVIKATGGRATGLTITDLYAKEVAKVGWNFWGDEIKVKLER